MTDDEWLADEQRRHNLSTYRWAAETRQPKRRYKFEPWQLAAAIKSLDKKENTNA